MMKKFLINKNKRMMSNKGSVYDILVFMIVAFILVLIFMSFHHVGTIITGLKPTLTTGSFLNSVPSSNPQNITQIYSSTAGQVTPIFSILGWASLGIIIALIISILITSFFAVRHPVFLILYIFFMIVFIVLGVILSNAYEDIITNTFLEDDVSAFVGVDFLLRNFPIVILVVSAFSAVLLYAGGIVNRQNFGSGGGI